MPPNYNLNGKKRYLYVRDLYKKPKSLYTLAIYGQLCKVGIRLKNELV